MDSRKYEHFIWSIVPVPVPVLVLYSSYIGVISAMSCYNFFLNCSYRYIIPVPITLFVLPRWTMKWKFLLRHLFLYVLGFLET